MPLTTEVNGKRVYISDEERCQTEVWTRVAPWGIISYRPVRNFNIGKKQEHLERVFFKESRVT